MYNIRNLVSLNMCNTLLIHYKHAKGERLFMKCRYLYLTLFIN